jgi:hypothetical protein
VKVGAPGTLMWANGQLHAHGWHFIVEPGDPKRESDQMVLLKDGVKAALLFIAKHHGITLVEPLPEAEPVASFDVERAAADAIAVARWEVKP